METLAEFDAHVLDWLNTPESADTFVYFDGVYNVARVVDNVIYGDFGFLSRPMLLWWRSVGRLSAVCRDAFQMDSIMHFEETDHGLTVLRMFPWHFVRSESTVGITCSINGVVKIAYKELGRMYGVERYKHVYYLKSARVAGETFVCYENLSLPHPDSDSESDDDDDSAAEPDEAAIALDKLVRSRIIIDGTRYYRASVNGKRVREPQTDTGYNALYGQMHQYLSFTHK